MTTDTLQDYEALLDSGFSEDQARAMVRVFASPRTDPEVLDRLDQIQRQLNEHSRVLEAILPLVQMIPAMSHDTHELKRDTAELKRDVAELKEDSRDLRANQHVIEERVKMEGRVSRMINATLIALGAIAASMAAVFAR